MQLNSRLLPVRDAILQRSYKMIVMRSQLDIRGQENMFFKTKVDTHDKKMGAGICIRQARIIDWRFVWVYLGCELQDP